MKMKANPENPAYSCVVSLEYKRLFNNKPGTIPTLGIRLKLPLEDMEVDLDAIGVVRPPEWSFLHNHSWRYIDLISRLFYNHFIFLYSLNCVVVQALQHVIKLVT